MIINFDDERGYLNEEQIELFQKAAHTAFVEELSNLHEEFEDFIEISLTVVTEDEIQSINAEYRGIDRVTDVLSFPQYECVEDIEEEIEYIDDDMTLLLGDVVICYDKVKSQAAEFGTTEAREFVYLFVHSLLHLLGYDHMEEDEKKIMRAHEENIMNIMGLAHEQ